MSLWVQVQTPSVRQCDQQSSYGAIHHRFCWSIFRKISLKSQTFSNIISFILHQGITTKIVICEKSSSIASVKYFSAKSDLDAENEARDIIRNNTEFSNQRCGVKYLKQR